MPSATGVFQDAREYEALVQSPEDAGARDMLVADQNRRGDQYMSLIQEADDMVMTTEDEDAKFDKAVLGRGKFKVRFGLVLTAVALLVAAVTVTKWSSPQGGVQHATQQNQQQTVAKFVDPCAPAAPAPAPVNPCAVAAVTTTKAADLCSSFHGLHNANLKACCFPACGAFCGAANCHMAPAGPTNCCTVRFATHLCGSRPYRNAPCMLPKTLNGALQMLANVGCENNPKAVAAITAFLAAQYGTPAHDIDVNCAPRGGGRRLAVGTNLNYVIRFSHNATITELPPTTNYAAEVNAQFNRFGAGITATHAFLPKPVTNLPESGNVDKRASTTHAFPTLTPVVEPEPELA
jgi:hypothetical protein